MGSSDSRPTVVEAATRVDRALTTLETAREAAVSASAALLAAQEEVARAREDLMALFPYLAPTPVAVKVGPKGGPNEMDDPNGPMPVMFRERPTD